MAKRHSDPQETGVMKHTKRPRTSAPASTAETDKNASIMTVVDTTARERHLSATISPTLLSAGDCITSKAPGGIRRRMNAESLAGRLGTGLVKELEALMQPGMTEMPPFAVRQEIQQRYGIDRRHIYDWFHNRGLRVASAEQREERRVAKARTDGEKRTLRNCRSAETGLNESNQSEPSESGISTPLVPAATSLPAISHEGPYGQMILPPMSGYVALPGITAYTSTSFTLPLYSSVGNLSQVPAERVSMWLAEQQKVPQDEAAYNHAHTLGSQPSLQGDRDIICPLDNDQILPQPQREAIYQTLADALPPARGIEESVGTYKAFMTQQVQTYYERLSTGTREAGSNSLMTSAGIVPTDTSISAVSSSNAIYNNTTEMNSHSPLFSAGPSRPINAPNEFSSWLLYGGRSRPGSRVPSPSCTPALSETATTATSSVYWLPDPFQDRRREPSGAASYMHINDLLESPVLRSRRPTYQGSIDRNQPADVAKLQHVQNIPTTGSGPNIVHHPLNPFPALPENFTSALVPVSAEFVHEFPYTHGDPSKRAGSRSINTGADNNAPLASTIFVAESGSENFSGTMGTSGQAVSATKGKGRGRPRGRASQKMARTGK